LTDSEIETPSGKDAPDENFPVGSRLIAPRLRPHVMTFYAFARAIDDVADNPDLAPEDKVARLEAFGAALCDPAADAPGLEKAAALRASLADTGVPAQHGLDLITAFKQDATKHRYADWDGTSFASPVATSDATLMLAAHPRLSPGQILATLRRMGMIR